TGIAIYHKDQAKILWYGLYEANGTNNSAELHGLLKGLQIAEHYLKQQVTVQVLSDSKYAIDCITKWAKGWKNKSWTRGQGEAIKNLDLIKQCFALYEQISSQVTISHVKGHANIEGNELADRMAVYARKTQESSFVRYDEAFDVSTVLAMTSG
ncbi:MAG: ribonuclease HI, partial [Alteromonadaceae bacterium]